jgi:hypothetical protein
MPGRSEISLFPKNKYHEVVIRIVTVFFKYNTIFCRLVCFLSPTEIWQISSSCLHNHKWLKKISKKVSSGFGTVQCNYLRYCVLREILKYGAINCNGSPLLCPINATYSSCCVFRHYSIQ